MHLATLLDPRALARFRSAAGREHQIAVTTSWAMLDTVLRALPIDLGVLDPRIDGRLGMDELDGLRRAYPSLPLLLYTAPSPVAMQDVVELGRHGMHDIFIEGYEDDVARVRSRLAALVRSELEARVLAMLSPLLRAASSGIAGTVTRLFMSPQLFASVADLSRVAGMPRRTFDRRLRALGFPPAHTLLVGARVLHAYRYARDPGYDLADVAQKLGYSDPTILSRNIRSVTGQMPTVWRRTATVESVLECLGTLLLGQRDTPRGAAAGGRNPDAVDIALATTATAAKGAARRAEADTPTDDRAGVA